MTVERPTRWVDGRMLGWLAQAVAVQTGAPVDSVVHELRIPGGGMGGQIPQHVVDRVWAAAVSRLPGVCLGVETALLLRPEGLGVLGHLLVSGSTTLDLVHFLVRYTNLLQRGTGEWRLHRTSGGSRIEWWFTPPIPVCHDHIQDLLVGAVARLLRQDGVEEGMAVELQHEPLGPMDRYRAAFGRNLTFGSARAAIWVSEERLAQSLPFRDAALRQTLVQLAERTLAVHAGSVPEKVRAALNDGHPDLSMATTAVHLGVSQRSLRRRLQESSVTYRELVSAHRQDRLLHQIAVGQLSTAQMAADAGYSSVQSMMRALRREPESRVVAALMALKQP